MTSCSSHICLTSVVKAHDCIKDTTVVVQPVKIKSQLCFVCSQRPGVVFRKLVTEAFNWSGSKVTQPTSIKPFDPWPVGVLSLQNKVILLFHHLQLRIPVFPILLAALLGDWILFSLIQTCPGGEKHQLLSFRWSIQNKFLSSENRGSQYSPEGQCVLPKRWRDCVLVNDNRERSGFFTTWETVQYYIRVSDFSNT